MQQNIIHHAFISEDKITLMLQKIRLIAHLIKSKWIQENRASRPILYPSPYFQTEYIHNCADSGILQDTDIIIVPITVIRSTLTSSICLDWFIFMHNHIL